MIDATLSMAEIAAKVKKPTSLFEIMANIKIVCDCALLLREDFYTAENFKHFFGGEKAEVNKSKSAKGWIRSEVSGFSQIIPEILINNSKYDALDLQLDRCYGKDLLTQALMSVTMNSKENNILFEDLEIIFGHPTKFISREAIEHRYYIRGGRRARKTHPHGDKRAEYSFIKGGVSYIVEIDTLPDGLFNQFSLAANLKI